MSHCFKAVPWGSVALIGKILKFLAPPWNMRNSTHHDKVVLGSENPQVLHHSIVREDVVDVNEKILLDNLTVEMIVKICFNGSN
jgi:hypothetical protein